MSDVMERPRTIPLKPPPARAGGVLEQRPVIERELSDLKQRVAETVLAAVEGKPDGRKNLAVLHDQIDTAEALLAGLAEAHQLALRLDREAVAAWFAALQDDPKTAVDGLTKKECCRRCTSESGCVITGGLQCGHPHLIGSVGAALMGNPKVRAVYQAAAKKLGIYQ